MRNPLAGATWGPHYWPWALLACLLILGGPEIFALATNAANTLSEWSWWEMGVVRGTPIWRWNAQHYLLFVTWCSWVSWLTFHLFFRVMA